MDFIKTNAVAIVSAIVAGAITYGSLSSELDHMKSRQSETSSHSTAIIQLQTELQFLRRDVSENRAIWEKLNTTLINLNTTLAVQGKELESVTREVKVIREAIAK